MSLIQEISQWTAAQAGLVMGSTCFQTHLPDDDGAKPVAVLYQIPGPQPPPASAYIRPNVEVRVRSVKDDPNGGEDLIERIFEIFHGLANLQLLSWNVRFTAPLASYQSIGRDEAGREEFSFSMELMASRK